MLINRETGEINSESSLEELPPELPIKDTRVPDQVPSVLAMSAHNRGQRDYLAIGVVVVALFVLIAGGLYVALYVNKSLAKGPLDSITKFMDDITEILPISVNTWAGRRGNKNNFNQKRLARPRNLCGGVTIIINKNAIRKRLPSIIRPYK
jgi:hypothetical protein